MIRHTGNDRTDSPRAWLALVTVLGAVFAWLLVRNLGLNPAIFADELYYSQMSRLQPLSEAFVPSYLYLWLFSASSACGTGFLDCVRVGNALLFVGAGPFIYLVARQVTAPLAALAITLVSLLAPVNLYTAFFMPEASYYFCFAVLSWLLLTRATWPPVRLALAGGGVLGLMVLVKVHALFLLPALCLFMVGSSWLRAPGARSLRAGLVAAIVLAAVTLGVRLGLGFVLAGEPALALVGKFYATAAASGTGSSPLDLLAPLFINGRAHLMVLALLMPLPMAALLLALFSPAMRQDAGAPFTRLALYAILTLGAAAGMTVAYTASIAGVGPQEVLRLHLRYYSFTFPLLLAVAAATAHHRRVAPRLRVLVALSIGAAVCAALVMVPRYVLNTVDSPELNAFDLRAWSGWAVAALALVTLALWARGQRLAAPLFLFVSMPLTIVLGGVLTSTFLSQIVNDWPSDRAGKAARDHVPRAERHLITVAGSEVTDIMRAQFHIDERAIGMLELAPGAPIEHYQLPARQYWLLVMGQHALPEGVTPVRQGPGYALLNLDTGMRLQALARLTDAYGGANPIVRAEGLSVSEPWGRWSTGKQVVLHFARPLPKQLELIIKARAYAANTTLPFLLRVGTESAPFRIAGSIQEVHLRLATDGAQRSVTIEVPRPTAPRTLGEWPDDRALGIGIAEIGIGTGPAQQVVP
ncbi:hypothetical protein AB2N08_13350 [Massilia aurea]|uniref:ArnT family glycosyltransferase n=1 Tax=Massilia aurea TaxID=373040 RepID=UPI003461C6FE